jgi:arylsulfatase A-like enzyme
MMIKSCTFLIFAAAAVTIVYVSSQHQKQEKSEIMLDNFDHRELKKKSHKDSATTSSSPNIIFILADDMGYGSIDETVSPNLHNMRNNGISLDKYYTQETCTPSRGSLLTGRYPLTIGLQFYENSVQNSGGLSLNETLFPEVLKDNGYVTYMFGKWNLGNASPRFLPAARGFDYFLGFLDGFSNYWSKLVPDMTDYKDFLYSTLDCYYMYDGDDMEHYSTHLYQDKAVAAIKAHDFSSPMFMYLAFQAVHDPFLGE